jgi:drug/metabolite transporter (DMT)-like permease
MRSRCAVERVEPQFIQFGAAAAVKGNSVSWRAWAAFAALCVIWGIPYFLIKVAVAEVPPLLVAWGRVALATGILLPIAWKRGALRSLRGHTAALCAFAVAEFAIPFAAISCGEQWISSSVAGILIATVPLWVVLLARSFGVHEPLGARRVIGLALGFIGVVALLGFGTISGPWGWAGVACMLVAALCYAVGPLIIQRHLRGLDAVGPLATCLAIAAVLLTLPAMRVLPAQWPSAAALASLVVLGILCTAIAMLLMFYLVSHAGASRASLITYINPAVASLLGIGLLHEHLGAGGVAAFGMILAGSWLASRGAAP